MLVEARCADVMIANLTNTTSAGSVILTQEVDEEMAVTGSNIQPAVTQDSQVHARQTGDDAVVPSATGTTASETFSTSRRFPAVQNVLLRHAHITNPTRRLGRHIR